MKLLPALALAALVAAPLLRAQAPSAPAVPTAPPVTGAPAKPATPVPARPVLPPQPPDVAAIKFGPDGQPNPGFMQLHERFLATAKEGKAQLLFLGDSITAGWGGAGKDAWAKAFAKYEPANFGIGGDRTQHVLWRITNGELDGIKPKTAVLMIGTNNVPHDSPEGIAKGVTRIVETLRAKLPETKILLLAVFPRGDKPDGKLGANNEKLKQVNALIARLDDKKHVHFLDIGSKFTEGKDTLAKEIMPDFLHLSPAGYEIWADAITPKLAELMK